MVAIDTGTAITDMPVDQLSVPVQKVIEECRKRRSLPGSENSAIDFEAHFRHLNTQYNKNMVNFKKATLEENILFGLAWNDTAQRLKPSFPTQKPISPTP